MLRIARRDNGIRSTPCPASSRLELVARRARASTRFVDVRRASLRPLPAASLSMLVRQLRYAVAALAARADCAPAWRGCGPSARARSIDGVTWYWPADGCRRDARLPTRCACSRPSIHSCGIAAASSCSGAGPIASRRTRPCTNGVRGYYALPLLWRDRVIGWANVTEAGPSFGYLAGHAPKDRVFTRELEAEVTRLDTFLR